MAGIAHVSEEHLRRLCRRRYGRSPMQHLTFLRIQRAKYLLSSTDDKIDSIARAVGYENPFTFPRLQAGWAGAHRGTGTKGKGERFELAP